MSVNHNKNWRIISVLLIILSSIYLTFIVDVYTLNTLTKKVFVFLYFCVMSEIVVWLRRKYFGSAKLRELIPSILLSMLLLALFQGKIIPNWEAQEVILRANVFDAYPTGEVWLVGAELDGQAIEPSQLGELTVNGWVFSPENDDYVFYPAENSETNMLSFYASAETVGLWFTSNQKSGSVLIEEDGKTERFVLRSGESQDELLLYTLSMVREQSLPERIVLGTGALIVISFLFSVPFSAVLRMAARKKA